MTFLAILLLVGAIASGVAYFFIDRARVKKEEARLAELRAKRDAKRAASQRKKEKQEQERAQALEQPVLVTPSVDKTVIESDMPKVDLIADRPAWWDRAPDQETVAQPPDFSHEPTLPRAPIQPPDVIPNFEEATDTPLSVVPATDTSGEPDDDVPHDSETIQPEITTVSQPPSWQIDEETPPTHSTASVEYTTAESDVSVSHYPADEAPSDAVSQTNENLPVAPPEESDPFTAAARDVSETPEPHTFQEEDTEELLRQNPQEPLAAFSDRIDTPTKVEPQAGDTFSLSKEPATTDTPTSIESSAEMDNEEVSTEPQPQTTLTVHPEAIQEQPLPRVEIREHAQHTPPTDPPTVKSLEDELESLSQLTSFDTSSSGFEDIRDLFNSPPIPAITIPSTPTRKPLVLVVDDSGVVRKTIRLTLEDIGCRVETAKHGSDALEQLTKPNAPFFDMIISDIEMPVMNGFELLTIAQQNPQTKHIPFAVITGSQENQDEACRLGCRIALKKPFQEQDIAQLVSSSLPHFSLHLTS